MKSIAALLFLAAPAFAEAPCGPTDQVFQKLAVEYGEEIVVTGTVQDTRMAVWANQETQTWTATMTRGDLTCIQAAGVGFAAILPKPNL